MEWKRVVMVLGVLACALTGFMQGHAEVAIDWNAYKSLPNGETVQFMNPHSLDVNNSGQAAAIYINLDGEVVVATCVQGGEWTEKPFETPWQAGTHSWQIGITDGGDILAVWSDAEDQTLTYAQAAFDGPWTVTQMKQDILPFSTIQDFDFNILGQAVIFRKETDPYAVIPLGIRWDILGQSRRECSVLCWVSTTGCHR